MSIHVLFFSGVPPRMKGHVLYILSFLNSTQEVCKAILAATTTGKGISPPFL